MAGCSTPTSWSTPAAGALPSAAGWRRWAARRPSWRREDCGWVYYGRHFRSLDGSVPPAFGPPPALRLDQPPHAGGRQRDLGRRHRHQRRADPALRAARHEETWTRIVKNYPLVAHWLEGEPLSEGVDVMAKLEDRHRRLWRDGAPTVTGSWRSVTPGPAPIRRRAGAPPSPASTPCAARRASRCRPPTRWGWRGASIRRRSTRWSRYRDTLCSDRHRLAEIDAQIAGPAA